MERYCNGDTEEESWSRGEEEERGEGPGEGEGEGEGEEDETGGGREGEVWGHLGLSSLCNRLIAYSGSMHDV